jgi:hypothetical protein
MTADEILAADARINAESRDEIEAALPPGKTYAMALDLATRRAAFMWNSHQWADTTEDVRTRELEEWCAGLCRGNKRAGASLAKDALWTQGMEPI